MLCSQAIEQGGVSSTNPWEHIIRLGILYVFTSATYIMVFNEMFLVDDHAHCARHISVSASCLDPHIWVSASCCSPSFSCCISKGTTVTSKARQRRDQPAPMCQIGRGCLLLGCPVYCLHYLTMNAPALVSLVIELTIPRFARADASWLVTSCHGHMGCFDVSPWVPSCCFSSHRAVTHEVGFRWIAHRLAHLISSHLVFSMFLMGDHVASLPISMAFFCFAADHAPFCGFHVVTTIYEDTNNGLYVMIVSVGVYPYTRQCIHIPR